MKHATDMQHPLTDEFAADLYVRTQLELVPELADPGDQERAMWEHATPNVRDVFRDRARRFMAGDLSVEPWRLKRYGPARVD